MYLWLIALSLAVLATSCSPAANGSQRTPSGSQNISQDIPGSPPSAPPDEPMKAIRLVDFKNFPYPSCISTAREPFLGQEAIQLKSGKLEKDGDTRSGKDPTDIALSNVSYYDLTGDHSEEAIVTLDYLFYPHDSAVCTYVYSFSGGSAKLLWQATFGPASFGALRRLSVEKGNLVVEQYIRTASDAYCCPRSFSQTIYKWDKKRFKAVSEKKLTNEYDNAEFLGFPD